MKKLYLSAVFFAALLLLVSFASAAVQIDSVTSPSGNPGSSANVQVTLRNTNPSSSVTVVLTSSDLTGPGGSITVPAITPNTVVLANNTASKTFSISLPFLIAGTYSGTLTATDSTDTTNKDSDAYSVTINSVFGLDVTDRDASGSKLVVSGEPGDRVTGTFKVKNTGSEQISDLALSFNQADFDDSDSDKITISHNMPTTLAPGAEATVTLNVNIDDAVDINTYSGTITVSGGGKSDAFTLEVRVQPEVCSDGKIGSLNLDLREPDSGDDFKPGQTIHVESKVENNANEDLDIAVTAFLFDVDDGDKVEEVDSDSLNIDEDDSDTIEFDLTVPDDVDDSHEFRLFVKAYEDGNEDEQCDETSVKLDVKREKHDTVVKSVRVDPTVAKPGSTISVTVTAQNIGSRDEDDVIISLRNSELGLDLASNSFSLEKFDDDDTQIERFTFKIPEDAEPGQYDIEAIVTFSSNTNSNFATLRVEGTPRPPEAFAALEVQDVPSSLVAGKAFDLSVKVTNEGDASATFTVELENVASWASAVQPKSITLAPGRSGTLFFTLQTKDSVTGSQSATVNVLSGSEVLDSETVSVSLTQPQTTPTGAGVALGSLLSGNTLWIIADIILVVIAIVFIRMLFRSKRREE